MLLHILMNPQNASLKYQSLNTNYKNNADLTFTREDMTHDN